jgi:hypothetical protein
VPLLDACGRVSLVLQIDGGAFPDHVHRTTTGRNEQFIQLHELRFELEASPAHLRL